MVFHLSVAFSHFVLEGGEVWVGGFSFPVPLPPCTSVCLTQMGDVQQVSVVLQLVRSHRYGVLFTCTHVHTCRNIKMRDWMNLAKNERKMGRERKRKTGVVLSFVSMGKVSHI